MADKKPDLVNSFYIVVSRDESHLQDDMHGV